MTPRGPNGTQNTDATKPVNWAGGWSKVHKKVGNILLIVLMGWVLTCILSGSMTLYLWAALLIVSSVYIGALDPLCSDATGWSRFRKGSGLVMLLYGCVLVVGAASGGKGLVRPLAQFRNSRSTANMQQREGLQFHRVQNLRQLQRALKTASLRRRPVMLDVYADWCSNCRKMEEDTFSVPKVQRALAGTILLRADVSANNAADKALVHHFDLIGLPSVLFFGPHGKEQRRYRVTGYLNASEFYDDVKEALGAKN